MCNNLKTGVIKHPKRGDVVLNAAYQEMVDYYHSAIIPAKPRTPRGKASVEEAVGQITTQIIAKLSMKPFLMYMTLTNESVSYWSVSMRRNSKKEKGPDQTFS